MGTLKMGSVTGLGEAMDVRQQVERLFAHSETRGEVKRWGATLDLPGSEALRMALVAEARARGVDLPNEAVSWPGKRLLRRALGRDELAQVVRTLTRIDEGFRCAHCGAEVPRHGRTARNHCPHCLRSMHVDVFPGDRAAACGGVLDPVGLELRRGHPFIRFLCQRCGAIRVNRALLDGAVPDHQEALLKVSSGTCP